MKKKSKEKIAKESKIVMENVIKLSKLNPDQRRDEILKMIRRG